MRKRIGIVMLGVLAIGTIWSLGYDWKITAILYATAVALIVYLGVALWLIFGGEEISEKKPAITTEGEVKTDVETPAITTEGEVKTDAETPAITTEGEVKTDAETAKPESLPQKRMLRRGSRSPRARS
jgi:hypothetical protein